MKSKLGIIKSTVFISVLTLFSCINSVKAQIEIHPIKHASLVIQYKNLIIAVDPAENIEELKSFPKPDFILITHEHPDHYNKATITALKTDKTIVIGNKSSIDKLDFGIYLSNGEKKDISGISIEAVPMYNLTEDRLRYHKKGNGNGYILTLGTERVYISGDTEDIKEMRELKNIDYAFVCMNLPFTMTPEQAASAVIAFKPTYVYPYHFSKEEYPANVDKFTKLVNEGCASIVRVLDWYETKN